MKRSLNFLTYAFLNTTLFLPYFLYLLIGNQYPTYLSGWFPLIIFYVCNLTGTFLINAFGKKRPTTKTLPLFLLTASLGSLMGALTFLSPIWLDLSSLLLGISCSVLLPLFTTFVYHERHFSDFTLSIKDNLLALVTILLFTPVVLLAVKFLAPEIGFILYAFAFGYCYFIMRQLPDYQLTALPEKKFNLALFILFLILTALTFVAKAVRILTDSHLIVLLIILALMAGIGIHFFVKSKQLNLALPRFVYYFSFLQGMITNFVILFGLFYSFTLGLGQQVYLSLYLSYGVGIFLSLFLSSLILSWLPKKLKPITFCGILLLIGSGLILIPKLLPLGAFLVGFFGNTNGRLLNRVAYEATTDFKDSSLLLKNRWLKLGSILQQTLLFLSFSIIGIVEHLSLTKLLQQITGHAVNQPIPKLASFLFYCGLSLWLIMTLLYSFGLYCYQKNKSCFSLKAKQD